MTDNEIIQALECLFGCMDCRKCPYSPRYEFPLCQQQVAKDTLDLINRQKAEIEQLHEDRNNYQNLYCLTVKDLETAKSEAIKEFLKLLIEKHSGKISIADIIDFAVDYLRGENNENL